VTANAAIIEVTRLADRAAPEKLDLANVDLGVEVAIRIAISE
jgi:hypothetical protein